DILRRDVVLVVLELAPVDDVGAPDRDARRRAGAALRDLPHDRHRRAVRDRPPRRRGRRLRLLGLDRRRRAARGPFPVVHHYFSSPKRVRTSSPSASRHSCASGPRLRIRIDVPFAATSISTPMMLFPFTTCSSFSTSTSHLNLLAVCTNFVAARACRPS